MVLVLKLGYEINLYMSQTLTYFDPQTLKINGYSPFNSTTLFFYGLVKRRFKLTFELECIK